MTPKHAFVGTYTDGSSDGIYGCTVDAGSDSALSQIRQVAVAENPSFLALHPTKDFLYAIEETTPGTASAFQISAQGDLQSLNRIESGAGGPCHCHVHPSGNYLLVAHYTGGAVSVLPIDDEGKLKPPSAVVHHKGSSVHPERQTEPHPHSIQPGPNGQFVYVPDLGTDEVVGYEFNDDGSLDAVSTTGVKEGAGPRHLSFHPTERFVFLINELDSTVTAFQWDRDTGALKAVDRKSTLPLNVDGDNATADIHVHPSGQYLYGSNRGHNSIAIFEVDEETGVLEAVGHEGTRGEWPRHFTFNPTGEYLFVENQYSDSIVVFRVDEDTGTLSLTGETINVPSPVCLKIPS